MNLRHNSGPKGGPGSGCGLATGSKVGDRALYSFQGARPTELTWPVKCEQDSLMYFRTYRSLREASYRREKGEDDLLIFDQHPQLPQNSVGPTSGPPRGNCATSLR